MVLSTETFNQSVRTEYSEAVNARYTFQPLWVSVYIHIPHISHTVSWLLSTILQFTTFLRLPRVSRLVLFTNSVD